MKKIFFPLTLSILISSCNSSNLWTKDLPVTKIESQKANTEMSDYQRQLNQAVEIMDKFPETREAFTEWKPESVEAFAFKQKLAEKLLNEPPQSRKISANTLEKIVKDKPVSTFEAESKKPINFDLDQGNHPNKLSEWWYYNGHMNTPDGRKYGYELCFFRSTSFLYFAHIAITDENNQKFYYSREFYSPKKIKLSKNSGDLQYAEDGGVEQTGKFSYKIWGKVKGFAFDLDLKLEKEPLLINGNGLIDMPEGTDSYYYSLTRMSTSGKLTANGQTSPVTGQSWFDHQWGNFIAYRIGWDWFSLQLDDGTEYNLFSFRNKKDQTLKQFVNVYDLNNKRHHSQTMQLKRLKWWKSPETGDNYVTKWELKIPQRKETFLIEAAVPGQEVFPYRSYDIAPTYWEGSSKVTKILPDGKTVSGLAYVEHFPYKNMVE